MNAKEKALELFDKMYNVDYNDDYGDPTMQYKHAKKCAIIAVDEILDIDCKDMSEEYFIAHIEYYQQVKIEIEKL